MANKTSTLKLVIAGDNKGAVKAVDGVGTSLGGLQGKLGSVGGALAGAFSVGAVTGFAKAAVSGYSEAGAAVATLSRVTGESAKDASLLAYAAQQSGIDATKAATAFGILATNIKKGKVDAAGIATTDANGNLKDFGSILGGIADKIEALPPGYQRAAAARDLFGRGGADLVKVLQNGSAGIEDLRKEMQDLGLEFDESGLKKYKDFVQVQRDLQAQVTGLEIAIGSKLVPVISAVDSALAHIPAPVRDAAGALALAGGAVGALSLAVGGLGPVLARGFAVINPFSGAVATSAVASAADAEAAVADEGAQQARISTLLEGTPAAAAYAASTEASAVALETEAAAADTAAGGLSTVSTVMLGATAGIGSYAAATGLLNDKFGKFHGSTQDVQKDLADLGSDVASVDDLTQNFGGSIESLAGKVKANNASFGDSIKRFGSVRQAQADLKALDGQFAQLAESGNVEGARKAYGQMVVALEDQGVAVEDIAFAFPQYLEAIDRSRAKTEQATTATDDWRTALLGTKSALEQQDDAVTKAVEGAQELDAAESQVADAHAATEQAQSDEAAARRSAAGDSDEYRTALAGIADAEAQVAEDQKSVTESQHDLNDARAEAVRRLDDLKRAVTETGDAELQAQDKLLRAKEEADRKNADPRASALDRKEAQDAVTIAEHDAASAAQDHTQAVADNAAAQKAGVEGDKQVVDAKQKVADAEDQVRLSVDKVAKANADARKVIVDAKAAVSSAVTATKDAVRKEADAWFGLAGQTHSATESALIYLDILKKLGADPAFIALLQGRVAGATGSNLFDQALAPFRNDGTIPTVSGPPRPDGTIPGKAGPGRSIVMNTTIVQQGTPRQTTRAFAAEASRSLDHAARRVG